MASALFEAILTIPSSLISTTAPLSSTISLITFPPAPITSLILSVGTFIVSILGALELTVSLALSRALAISPRIWILPFFACDKAVSIISLVIPVILISICKEVIPSFVPATLKSISPRWSSSPRISDKTATLSSSLIRPMAIPATGFDKGIPASIIDKEDPQTVAIDEDPFDSVISETSLIV